MSARAALPVLLLALLAFPARADLYFPVNACEEGGKKEGDSCRDNMTSRQLGQCRTMQCTYWLGNIHYDCFRCATPAQFAVNQRDRALNAEQATRTRPLRWGLGVLGAGCVLTAVWYKRRRSKDTGSAST
ncbi:hypothetical protein NR798_46835 [Archangium gephyra]|uniref:hypothetical protein n=1 Tax=Archangium gephyra TaxID=48 RepID=UPI0035D4BBFC